jgi:hypothetical protein
LQEEVEKAFLPFLKKLYLIFKNDSSFQRRFTKRGVQAEPCLLIEDFCRMLQSIGIVGKKITLEDVKLCYVFSKLLTVDEVAIVQSSKPDARKVCSHEIMTFLDFVESVARLTCMMAMPDCDLRPKDDPRPLAEKLTVLLPFFVSQTARRCRKLSNTLESEHALNRELGKSTTVAKMLAGDKSQAMVEVTESMVNSAPDSLKETFSRVRASMSGISSMARKRSTQDAPK